MVTIVLILRVEAPLHLVKDIKKLILFVEDAAEWATINKVILVQHVDIPQPHLENVKIKINIDGWSKKVQQRKGTGTGRMRYLKTIPRVYKNQIKGLSKWSKLFKFILFSYIIANFSINL